MADAHADAGCVEYHGWWPGGNDPFWLYNQADNGDRIEFYNITGTPTIKVDGKYPAGAANLPTMYNSRINAPSEATCEVSGDYDSNTRTGSIIVTTTSSPELPDDNYVIRVAVIESGIYYNTSYNDMHYNVMRDMLPNAFGTPVAFTGPRSTEQVNLNFTLAEGVPPNGGIVEENAELIVWLQPEAWVSPVNAKVINGARVAILDLAPATAVDESAVRYFDLQAAYPNPFNPNTKIPVQVDKDGSALLEIVDVNGRIISQLHNGMLTEGAHEFRWDGTNSRGDVVASGVYMAKLTSATDTQMERLVLLK